MTKTSLTALIGAGVLAVTGAPAFAAGPHGPLQPNDNSPHNMGYCARYLGGGGLGVRPAINRMLAAGAFGYANPGELYSARARDAEDRACLRR